MSLKYEPPSLADEKPDRLPKARPQREFVIDNLLVRIHFIIVMIRWTGLAPWEFEFHFPGSLTSFLSADKEPDGLPAARPHQREFFIGNLLVRIHFIIVMITWTGLAPWEFEFPFR